MTGICSIGIRSSLSDPLGESKDDQDITMAKKTEHIISLAHVLKKLHTGSKFQGSTNYFNTIPKYLKQ